jgi:hypothetical protein
MAPSTPDWTALRPQDPGASVCAGFQQAIDTELLIFRHALPMDDKRAFFRSPEEAQAVLDRAVRGLPAGLRARVASIHATRADLDRAVAEGAGTFLYFRIWGLLVEFQKAA